MESYINRIKPTFLTYISLFVYFSHILNLHNYYFCQLNVFNIFFAVYIHIRSSFIYGNYLPSIVLLLFYPFCLRWLQINTFSWNNSTLFHFKTFIKIEFFQTGNGSRSIILSENIINWSLLDSWPRLEISLLIADTFYFN